MCAEIPSCLEVKLIKVIYGYKWWRWWWGNDLCVMVEIFRTDMAKIMEKTTSSFEITGN